MSSSEIELQPVVSAQPPSEGAAVAASAEDPEPEPMNREQRRSRRKRKVRARTISVKRMTKREQELGRLLFPIAESDELRADRPLTRADCHEGLRPCPFVSCKFNLYLDVQPRTGAIKMNFPDLEVEDMHESCVLDIADRGGQTLEDTGTILNLTRERIRQLEVRAMAKVKTIEETFALRDFVDEGPVGKRRLPVLVSAPDDEEENDFADEAEPEDAPDDEEQDEASDAGNFDVSEVSA